MGAISYVLLFSSIVVIIIIIVIIIDNTYIVFSLFGMIFSI